MIAEEIKPSIAENHASARFATLFCLDWKKVMPTFASSRVFSALSHHAPVRSACSAIAIVVTVVITVVFEVARIIGVAFRSALNTTRFGHKLLYSCFVC